MCKYSLFCYVLFHLLLPLDQLKGTLNDLVFSYESLTHVTSSFKSPNFWIYDCLLYQWYSPMHECKIVLMSSIINKKLSYIFKKVIEI